MSPVQSGALGKDILGQIAFAAQLPDRGSELLLNVLHSQQFRATLLKTILVITRET